MGLLGEALRSAPAARAKPVAEAKSADPGGTPLRLELQRQGLSAEAVQILEAFERERNPAGSLADWLGSALRTYRRIDWIFQITQRIEQAPQKPTAVEAKQLITAAIAVYVGIVSGR